MLRRVDLGQFHHQPLKDWRGSVILVTVNRLSNNHGNTTATSGDYSNTDTGNTCTGSKNIGNNLSNSRNCRRRSSLPTGLRWTSLDKLATRKQLQQQKSSSMKGGAASKTNSKSKAKNKEQKTMFVGSESVLAIACVSIITRIHILSRSLYYRIVIIKQQLQLRGTPTTPGRHGFWLIDWLSYS